MGEIQQIIAGNWKMNLTLSQGRAFVSQLMAELNGKKLSKKFAKEQDFFLDLRYK